MWAAIEEESAPELEKPTLQGNQATGLVAKGHQSKGNGNGNGHKASNGNGNGNGNGHKASNGNGNAAVVTIAPPAKEDRIKFRPAKPGKGNGGLVETATTIGLPEGFNVQPSDIPGGAIPRPLP